MDASRIMRPFARSSAWHENLMVSAGFVPANETTFLTDAELLSAKMIIIAEGKVIES